MQPILEKLYRAESMSQQESQQLFSAIVRGELEPSQLAAALISMKVRGERPEEIAGAAKALLDDAQPFPRPDYPFADIVGTGGDGTNSINISTASASSRRRAARRSPSTATAASPAAPAPRICSRRSASVWICRRKKRVRRWTISACVSCSRRSTTPVFATPCRCASS